MLMAWSEVFRDMVPGEFRDVFPVEPAARGFSWALRLAETFLGLQATLGEIGWRIADVPLSPIGAEGRLPEEARWRKLAELEGRYDAALRRRSRIDIQAARASCARHGGTPAGIERAVVIATPDPLPVALSVLTAIATSLPVDILVYAPKGEADAFDEWGRPVPAAWNRRAFALAESPRDASGGAPKGKSQSVCHAGLCADAAAQAERVAAIAARYDAPDGLLGIGVADPDVLPALESVFGHARIAAFNPEGRALRGGGLYQLLSALAAVSRETRFSAVEALARCPDFIAFLRERLGAAFSTEGWLSGLDRMRDRHLPQDLAAARARIEARESGSALALGLAEIDELAGQLSAGPFAEGAAEALRRIFGGRRFDLDREGDARLADEARAWAGVVQECAPAASGLSPAEGWELALRLFGSTVRTDEKPAGAVEFQGWLELLWEDAPHLAVVGLNDGRVPAAIAGDPFLPETLRERIGLRSNESRFARDAYILRAISASRESGGRLDVFLGRTSEAGDALKPSRLLLQCADAELPGRIALLFREPELSGRNMAWDRAWRVKPPPVRPLLRVPVTGLRGWLSCPFRFYLRNVLKMEAVDPEKGEMNDADFGTLCHRALEAMARDERMRDCADGAALRDLLAGALEREARARFGSRLILPLVVQLESARQRLEKAAEVEARERAQGWRTLEVERRFEIRVEGVTVAGSIDRIDRNLETGRIRILDYKTSDTPLSPEEAHLKRAGRGPVQARDFAQFGTGRELRVWRDLQLPLYMEALAGEFPAADCGYFNLPKAVGDTGVQLWESYSAELHASALRCAEGVCKAVRSGDFWPPNETVESDRDEFAALFHHGAAESIEWEGAP
jgi:ATP-dependent helicase/nuclease subunit B